MKIKHISAMEEEYRKLFNLMQPHELAMLTVLLSVNRSRLPEPQSWMPEEAFEIRQTAQMLEDAAEFLLQLRAENPVSLTVKAFAKLEQIAHQNTTVL